MFKGFRSIIIAILILCFVPIVLATYPLINVTSPLNQTYNINNITFNITLNETGACNYSLDGGLINVSMNSVDNLTFEYTSTSMNDGNYTITFYCVNVTDEVSSASISFAVDITYPTIMFNPDTDNFTLINRNYIIINVSVNDTNLNYTTIDIYNSTGGLINTTTYTTIEAYINYTVPADGLYFFNATVYDWAWNINYTETRNITIDTTAPTFDYLNNQTILNNESLAYDINATDTYAGVSCFQVNDTANFKIDCAGLLENNTQLVNGIYQIDITVNDTLGNTYTESINITVTESDLIAPIINILYPINAQYNYSVSAINYTYYDIHPGYCWYSNDSGVWNSTPADIAGTNWTSITSNEGSNTWTIYCNDTIGNFNSTNITFIVDTINPLIIDTSGLSTGYYNETKIINITITDANNFNASLYVNGSIVNSSTGTNTSTLTYTLLDGNYTYYVTATDGAGNTNTTISITDIIIDTTNPLITFISPSSSGTTIYTSDIVFNLTATDTNLVNITLYVYDGTYVLINITQGNSTAYIELTNLSDGIYYYNATAYDIIGNVNITETYNITIDTTIPTIYYEPTTDNTSFVNRNYILINVSTININTTNLTINLYNSSMSLINYTSANATNLSFNFSDLADGLYYFNATADDGLGINVSTSTRNITIDTINPEIIFNPDTDNTILVNRNYIIINVTTSDPNLNYTIITIYNSTNGLINTTNYTGTEAYINYTVPEDGLYYYNATVYDLVGHTNSTETRNITIDATAPAITIITPTNIAINKNYIEFNITITDDNIGNTTLNAYNSTYDLINTTRSNTTELYINLTGLTEDVYYYNITTTDTLGHTNSTITYNITIDTTAPSIAITSPNNTVYTNATQLVNITSDGNTIWFWNGTANQTYSGETYITWSEGTNNIYAYTNDTAGNINQTNITFTIDTANPTITFNTPSSATSTTASNTFNVTAIDDNIQDITLYIYNSTYALINTTTGVNSAYVTVSLTNGVYYYNATAYDTLGHVNNTETRNLTVSITIPSPPGGSSPRSDNTNTGSTNSMYFPTVNRTNTTGSVTIIEYLTDLQKGQRNVSINRIGAAITLLTLNITNSTNLSSNIKIVTQSTNPLKESINATIYTYMSFNTTIQPTYLNGIGFRFKVEKTWITKNNLTSENVTIYTYNDNKKSWSDSHLSKYSEDDEYVYYTSNSTKFTTLALGSPLTKYVESIKTEKNPTEEIVSGNNTAITNNLATIKHKDFYQRTGDFFANAWQNMKTYAINLSPEVQSLVIITLSSIFILIIGVVSGVLVYQNAIKPRRMRRAYNKNIISRILPYEEETPKAPAPEVRPPVEHIIIKNNMADSNTTPDPEFCVRKVNELLLQCEYALDNGKVVEAKEFYASARNMYFNSGLSYEEKSRVYNKIIELYARFNKKK